MLVPSLADTRMTSSRGMASTFSSSSMTTSGWAEGRSILLMTGTMTRPCDEREVDVGERLGLDALGGVDDEDGALAGLQAAADLVAEVDVAGRVDEVEAVGLAVAARAYSRRTARALMVMPFSRSRSIESSTWLVIWRASMVCVSSRMRSASVDLPWSTWAMMLKLRRRD